MANKFWSELTHRLTPYVPGEQRHGDKIVKLNTNENPYPPSPRVLEALAAVDGGALRRYPDPESVRLRTALADQHALDVANVFVGNGSDEILGLAFMAFFTAKSAQSTSPPASLQYPELSYSFYPVYCELLDIESCVRPLRDDFSIDMDAFEDNGGGIIFPNPNAPTSLAQSAQSIEALLIRVPNTLVLVDEAYVDFGAQSMVKLVNKYPNLVVSQTFSKSRSLAGMRLGAAYANNQLIEALTRVKNSFNSYPVDAVAQQAGIASISDEAYYQQTLMKVIRTRAETKLALEARGFRVLDSAANFLFVSPADKNACALYEHLNRQGVLVRFWSSASLAQWLRISIGTDEEMQALLKAIDEAEYAI